MAAVAVLASSLRRMGTVPLVSPNAFGMGFPRAHPIGKRGNKKYGSGPLRGQCGTAVCRRRTGNRGLRESLDQSTREFRGERRYWGTTSRAFLCATILEPKGSADGFLGSFNSRNKARMEGLRLL